MTIIDALKSAQYVVDQGGHKTAVLLDIRAWQTLIDWIENIADAKIAAQALTELEATGGRPHQAGWLDWDQIREEWDVEEAVEAVSL